MYKLSRVPLLYSKTYNIAISGLKTSTLVTERILNQQMKVILAQKVTQKLTLLDLVIKLQRSISRFPDISLKVIYI